MQAALGLGRPCPASGARVFARLDGAGAMRASNAGKVLVVERIVENVMFVHVVPDHAAVPVGNGIDLHQLEFLVPLDFAGVGAGAPP